jgi:hypothetical protein
MIVVGTLAALVGTFFCFILSMLDPLSHGMLEGRAGVALLAALAFVAAEAILFVRPWFYRAARMLVVAWVVIVPAGLVLTDGVADGLGEALVLVVLSFIVIGPIMAYLGEKNRLMPRHPRAFLRVPGSRGTP